MNWPSTTLIIVLLVAYGILVPHMILKTYSRPTVLTEQEPSEDGASVSVSVVSKTLSPPPSPPPHKMCVNKQTDLPKLLNSTENVIVLMPAKVAGTTFTVFTGLCMGVKRQDLDNKAWKNFLRNSYQLRSVVAHHALSPTYLQDTVRHASRRSLIVWIHREESSRLISAIRQVVKVICKEAGRRSYNFELLHQSPTKCVISEQDLIRNVIEEKIYEIGKGAERVLQCDSYRTMTETRPRIIFTDYMQSDDIMMEIAKRHCPHIVKKLPVHSNVASNFETELLVKLSKKYESTKDVKHTVPLDDWLTEKGSQLEMMLKLKTNMTCQGTTRRMEESIRSCEDHVIRLDEEWIG